MNLKEFSLFEPTIESGTVLKAIENAIPASAMKDTVIFGLGYMVNYGYMR
jgi:hypothetical protein